jgi:2-hydroxychromene-2-carboxylate isomerase
MTTSTFYYDLGSPYAYLSAERLAAEFPGPVRWQPVLLGGIFAENGRSSWAAGAAEQRASGIAEVEHRARDYGLPDVRWPEPWPSNYLMAMRAATYAFTVEVGPEFTLHAFRAAFQRGSDLALAENVLAVGEGVGIASADLERGVGDPVVKQSLRDATEAAHAIGVIGVPTLTVGEALFWGDDRLQEAALLAQA